MYKKDGAQSEGEEWKFFHKLQNWYGLFLGKKG